MKRFHKNTLHKSLLCLTVLLLLLFSGCAADQTVDTAAMMKAYEAQIASTEDAVAYAYIDLNDDGLTELVLKTGYNEGSYRFKFYGYQRDEVVLVGDEIASYSYLAHDGLAYVIAGGHEGREWSYLVTYINTLYRCQMQYDQPIHNGKYTEWPNVVELTPVQ
ncbi:MAG: hypothetical protein E7223_06985 [Clostridiales bacterium]|nr:hypothetical protein [Clostridiales bacterium]